MEFMPAMGSFLIMNLLEEAETFVTRENHSRTHKNRCWNTRMSLSRKY